MGPELTGIAITKRLSLGRVIETRCGHFQPFWDPARV